MFLTKFYEMLKKLDLLLTNTVDVL
jgi:hypothetical protein